MQSTAARISESRGSYTFLRYFISLALLFYGFAKLEGAQFTVLDSELDKPMSQVSGFWLTWYYFGYSSAYGSIIALIQVAGAILLMFRKTTLLATCLLLPVLFNIVLIDIFFGIGAGLLPAILILGALICLLWYHNQEIFRIFWHAQRSLASSSTSNAAKWAARSCMIVGSAIFVFWVARYNNRSPTPVDGAWQIVDSPMKSAPALPATIYFEYNRSHLCVFKMTDGTFSAWQDFAVEPKTNHITISARWRYEDAHGDLPPVIFDGTYLLRGETLQLAGKFADAARPVTLHLIRKHMPVKDHE